MSTYTYAQLLQITQQAGYQGAQAQGIATTLYNQQTSSTADPATSGQSAPPDALTVTATRGAKLGLGLLLGAIGIFVLVEPAVTGAASKVATTANPLLGTAATIENIRTNRAARARHTAELEDLQGRQARRRPSTPKPPGDFVTRREPGKRARTYPAGAPLATERYARYSGGADPLLAPRKGRASTTDRAQRDQLREQEDTEADRLSKQLGDVQERHRQEGTKETEDAVRAAEQDIREHRKTRKTRTRRKPSGTVY